MTKIIPQQFAQGAPLLAANEQPLPLAGRMAFGTDATGGVAPASSVPSAAPVMTRGLAVPTSVGPVVAPIAPAKAEPYGPPYIERPEVLAYIKSKAGSDKRYLALLNRVFTAVPQRLKPNPNAPPTGEDLPFDRYLAIFDKPETIKLGVDFARAHAKALAAARDRYGVDPQAILGILCVETKYGTVPDTTLVVNALVQRAFDGTRTDYFKSELDSFLTQARADGWDIENLRGSSAGAFGIPQFMPSNLPRFGVSSAPPRPADLFNPDDAILSVGNYLQKATKPWTQGRPAVVDLSGNLARLQDQQKITVAELTKLGFALPDSLPPGTSGTIFKYATADGEHAMFMGPNAEVIRGYNNSRDYMAGTWHMGVIVYDAWKKSP